MQNGSSATALRMGVLALMWGSTFLWIKIALAGLTPVQVVAVRCALGTLVLLGLCAAAHARLPRGRIWGHVVVAAFFCNAFPFALLGVGESTVDSGVAGVLNATTPLWSLLIGLLIGTERQLPLSRVGGLALGFAGVLLIFAPWQHGGLLSWGCLAVLGAAASYAIGFAYMSRHLVGKGAPTIALSAAQLLAATGFGVLALPVDGLRAPHLDARTALAVVVLSVVCTALTFHLTYRLIADEGATNAATVGYLLPVVSVALGALVLHEMLTVRVIAGMVVVLAGVGLTRRRPPVTERALTEQNV